MNQESDFASRWRVELAVELARYYEEPEGIKMIVLGGSPVRGLSDGYSDLDIVVYWDVFDISWLEKVPLREVAGGERKFFLKRGEAGTYLEQYYFGELKVDFGHVTMDLWEQWVDDVLQRYETTAAKQKTLGGFLAAKPLYGERLYGQWKERIAAYPDELGRRMVKRNLGFYTRGCLAKQGWERGDLLFFYDGLCLTLKKLLGILAGLNKVYFSTDEPRWIAYELAGMPISPPNAWERMKSVLESDGPEAVEILDELIVEVLALVAEHMPEIDLTRLRRMFEQEVKACHVKPPLGKK